MIKWVGYPDAEQLGALLEKGLADQLDQQPQDRIDLALKIAREWRPLIVGEPLMTFVEMMYCSEALAHKIESGESEACCRQELQDALNRFQKKNLEAYSKFEKARNYDRI